MTRVTRRNRPVAFPAIRELPAGCGRDGGIAAALAVSDRVDGHVALDVERCLDRI